MAVEARKCGGARPLIWGYGVRKAWPAARCRGSLGVAVGLIAVSCLVGCAADASQGGDGAKDKWAGWPEELAAGQVDGADERACGTDGPRVLSQAEFAAWLNTAYHEIYVEDDNTYYDALRKTAGMAVQLAVAQTDLVGGPVEQRTTRLASLLEVIAAKFKPDWGVSRFDVGVDGTVPLFVGTKGPLYPMLLVHPVTGAVYSTRSPLGPEYLTLLQSKPPQAFSELVKRSDVFSVHASPEGGTVIDVNFERAHLLSRVQP